MFCTSCGRQNPDSADYCAQCGTPVRSVVAPVTLAPTSAAIPDFHYAGFWLRFWAYLIDCVILGSIPVLIAVIMAPVFFTGGLGTALLGSAIFLFPVIVTEGWLYYALMESSTYQATLGKRVFNLKVTAMSGEPIGFGKASLRYFGKILSHLIFSIGYIMAAFTAKKQALHDKIAGCLVIRDEPRPVIRGLSPQPFPRS